MTEKYQLKSVNDEGATIWYSFLGPVFHQIDAVTYPTRYDAEHIANALKAAHDEDWTVVAVWP